MHDFTPCVIWAMARVGSTALGQALGALNEPFQLLGEQFSGAREIERVCATHRSIKHLYEECPDESNIALAHAANQNGYRHIHLVRCNEFARLLSRGIATQCDAWTPEDTATRFEAVESGDVQLGPVNVEHLLSISRGALIRWRAIREHVGSLLTLRFEDVTSANCGHRRQALQRLCAYLGMAPDRARNLERSMTHGEQRTQDIWRFVPNMCELRQALVAEGAL